MKTIIATITVPDADAARIKSRLNEFLHKCLCKSERGSYRVDFSDESNEIAESHREKQP